MAGEKVGRVRGCDDVCDNHVRRGAAVTLFGARALVDGGIAQFGSAEDIRLKLLQLALALFFAFDDY